MASVKLSFASAHSWKALEIGQALRAAAAPAAEKAPHLAVRTVFRVHCKLVVDGPHELASSAICSMRPVNHQHSIAAEGTWCKCGELRIEMETAAVQKGIPAYIVAS